MLEIDDVSHAWPGGIEALRAVQLRVQRGEIMAVVGRSGCGKSTLLRIAAGLLKPAHGRVTIDGALVRAPRLEAALMFQDAALLPWRTVRANIELPLELQRRTDEGRVMELLDMVGLKEFAHALPEQLSGGMAQRCALARALVLRPQLLLLDEPFGALDALTREGLTQSLYDLARSAATTTLLVTHSIAEAVFLADRIVVLTPRPGQVAATIDVDLPHPRRWEMQRTPEFAALVGTVRDALQ